MQPHTRSPCPISGYFCLRKSSLVSSREVKPNAQGFLHPLLLRVSGSPRFALSPLSPARAERGDVRHAALSPPAPGTLRPARLCLSARAPRGGGVKGRSGRAVFRAPQLLPGPRSRRPSAPGKRYLKQRGGGGGEDVRSCGAAWQPPRGGESGCRSGHRVPPPAPGNPAANSSTTGGSAFLRWKYRRASAGLQRSAYLLPPSPRHQTDCFLEVS